MVGRIRSWGHALFETLLRSTDAFGVARVQGYRDEHGRATPTWEHLAEQERERAQEGRPTLPKDR
jgi:arginine/ornithine N-succinyltransferase beta subunit